MEFCKQQLTCTFPMLSNSFSFLCVLAFLVLVEELGPLRGLRPLWSHIPCLAKIFLTFPQFKRQLYQQRSFLRQSLYWLNSQVDKINLMNSKFFVIKHNDTFWNIMILLYSLVMKSFMKLFPAFARCLHVCDRKMIYNDPVGGWSVVIILGVTKIF